MFKKDVEPLKESGIDPSLDPLRVGLGRLHLDGRQVGWISTEVRTEWTVEGPFWHQRFTNPHEDLDWSVEFIDYQAPWNLPDFDSYWFETVTPDALLEGCLQLPLPTGGDVQFEVEWMHGEDLRINLKPWYGYWDKSAADRITE